MAVGALDFGFGRPINARLAGEELIDPWTVQFLCGQKGRSHRTAAGDNDPRLEVRKKTPETKRPLLEARPCWGELPPVAQNPKCQELIGSEDGLWTSERY